MSHCYIHLYLIEVYKNASTGVSINMSDQTNAVHSIDTKDQKTCLAIIPFYLVMIKCNFKMSQLSFSLSQNLSPYTPQVPNIPHYTCLMFNWVEV